MAPNSGEDLREDLKIALQDLFSKPGTEISKHASAVPICKEICERLKNCIRAYNFKNAEEEILFFKQTKPHFYATLMYHLKLFNILVEWPESDPERANQYRTQWLRKIARVKKSDFIYQYYRAGQTSLDQALFTRKPKEEITRLSFPDIFEENFFTTHFDMDLAAILCNDKLVQYLSSITIVENPPLSTAPSNIPTITYTGPKVGLVEVIYGFAEDNAFNNGEAKLKDIFACIGNALNVVIDNPTRTFQEILSRKEGYTTYLKHLANKIEARAARIEQRHIR